MYSVVLVTCPRGSSEKIANEVLKRQLAACVNIFGPMRSRYWWKGKLESADESLLIIKTRTELFEKLEMAIKRAHPYQTPEIVELRVERGSRQYLDWIKKETWQTARKGKR